MKKIKGLKNAHTANTKFGMGDYQGSAIKAKVGRMREDSVGMRQVSPKKLKKPPKALA